MCRLHGPPLVQLGPRSETYHPLNPCNPALESVSWPRRTALATDAPHTHTATHSTWVPLIPFCRLPWARIAGRLSVCGKVPSAGHVAHRSQVRASVTNGYVNAHLRGTRMRRGVRIATSLVPSCGESCGRTTSARVSQGHGALPATLQPVPL